MAMTRKRVLWVDDEIEFLRSHIMFLETRGYSVTPAFNGDDALQILRENPRAFNIVLLDEQMPGKDGLTTLEEIKELLPDLPVVMVTKSEEEQVMEDALGKHIDGYLTKPVNPSQILSVCKRILDSSKIISTRITQRFIRSYSENRAALQNQLTARTWAAVYENLTRWDLELESVVDEGIRQTHAGQKSDANALFSRYVIENYVEWTNGNRDAPVLSPRFLDEFVIPRLKEGEKLCLVVLDCLRLDQLLVILPLLKKHFTTEHGMFYATMPTSTPYTRVSLLSGLYPDQVYDRFPEVLDTEPDDRRPGAKAIETMLREKLETAGVELGEDLVYSEINDTDSGKEFLGSVESLRDKRLVVVPVDFVALLIQSRSDASVLQQIAPDESAFRRLTGSWFQYSNILRIIREMGERGYTVLFTSANGSVLCTRGTELYGDEGRERAVRYRFGEKISCDERHALFLPELDRFRLPRPTAETCGLILREDYYYTHHDTFENYKNQYRNSFQHGGISLEEIITPLVILRSQ